MTYHPCEIDRVLRSLVVLVDTREQNTARALLRYKSLDCPYEHKALKFGDYSARLVGLQGEDINLESVVAIERKMHLDELCGCFCQSRKRFRREFEKARDAGAHMYLLIENGSLDEAYKGLYRSQMKSQSLIASVLAWSIEFDLKPMFISSAQSGKLIHDILYREAKQYLERGGGGNDG